MTIIDSMLPALEFYIDEAFAELTGMPGDLEHLGRQIRATVLRGTGIPVGVSIAATKTLANQVAKRFQNMTGGLVDLLDMKKIDWVLRNTCVGEIWGIGLRIKSHLEAMGILTAMDLPQADACTFANKFSMVLYARCFPYFEQESAELAIGLRERSNVFFTGKRA